MSESTIQAYYRDRYARIGQEPENNGTQSQRVAAAIKVLSRDPMRVLDFGCNVGTAASAFYRAGHQVVGVDISHSAIKIARERVPSATFEVVESEG